MKKRIFIAMHYMEIGGAETSLIGLLQAMDYTRYDVDLFVFSHQGKLMQFIPKEVNLLPEDSIYSELERPLKDVIKRGHLGIAYGRLKGKLLFQRYVRSGKPKESAAIFQYIGNAVTPFLHTLYRYGEYDIAISFLNPHNIVAEKVKAKKKICWIHTDYTKIDINKDIELPVWEKYDHIVSISPDVTTTFLTVFPSLKNKIVEIENILSSEFVKNRAEQVPQSEILTEMPLETNVTRILSVGRFSAPKNYDNVPDICKRINRLGQKVKWYIIGYGDMESQIRNKIHEAGMENDVILLGKRNNPYPYIKACDIYVQPSRYEGKSVTVREAQMLLKPVVVTDYPTAHSQVKDMVDGVIVPMDNSGCAEGIYRFINNKRLQEAICSHLKSCDYGNMNEIMKLYKLID